jgi:hemoglobin
MKSFVKACVAVSLIAVLAAATLVSAARAGQDNMAKEKSLYDRLGGEAAISAVIDDFAGRVLADARINKKFAKSNAERLVFHLKEQVCAVTGGPCKYTGNSMTASHKNMKVTEGEFNALVEDLVMTLDKFNVPAREKGEVLTALGGLKSQIVEVMGDATGTPLPDNFKPAPPLDKKKVEKGPFGGKGDSKKM